MKPVAGALILLLGAAFCSGCAIGLGKSVHQFTQLDYTKTEEIKSLKEEVEAIGSQYVFLYFTFSADYASDAYNALLAKCENGRIVNISARHSTDLGILAYRNKLILKGTCIRKS